MNIELSPSDQDRTHRIGKKKPGQNKTRPIIVKLSRYNVRKKVFSNKKKSERIQCKCNGKLNTKTNENSKEGKDITRFTNVWTSDGTILYKSATDNKVKLYYK